MPETKRETQSQIATVPVPAVLSPEEDAARVERVLGHIAGQSHFEERYSIVRELAKGGMGYVYHAFDQVLRRDVAVKMMHAHADDRIDAPAIRGQFLKEARVGGRLLHPNVLSVFDVGVNRKGQIYYTMRLVDGASLQKCLDGVDQGVLTKLISYPLRQIVKVFVGVCEGIDFAHQQKVIHLDLKPQNVLVSGFHEVFVIDWGLARVDDTDDTEKLLDLYNEDVGTVSATGVFGGRVVGTPSYMAPEQAIGGVSEFSPATDVYGLGGILYFILFGRPPNPGNGSLEIMGRITEAKKAGKLREGILPRGQRVPKEAKEAVESLTAICLKAIATGQGDRFQSADDMIVELSEWLKNTPGPPHGF
jgi:serine/threonine-protein kinase